MDTLKLASKEKKRGTLLKRKLKRWGQELQAWLKRVAPYRRGINIKFYFDFAALKDDGTVVAVWMELGRLSRLSRSVRLLEVWRSCCRITNQA